MKVQFSFIIDLFSAHKSYLSISIRFYFKLLKIKIKSIHVYLIPQEEKPPETVVEPSKAAEPKQPKKTTRGRRRQPRINTPGPSSFQMGVGVRVLH